MVVFLSYLMTKGNTGSLTGFQVAGVEPEGFWVHERHLICQLAVLGPGAQTHCRRAERIRAKDMETCASGVVGKPFDFCSFIFMQDFEEEI